MRRDNRPLFGPSRLGPELVEAELLDGGSRVVDVRYGNVDEEFPLPWGKTSAVVNRCSSAVITFSNTENLRWQIELRAYDDGVAFRYRLLRQEGLLDFTLRGEATRFQVVGQPEAPFQYVGQLHYVARGFVRTPAAVGDAFTEASGLPAVACLARGSGGRDHRGAAVRHFAGMYLERESMADHGAALSAVATADAPGCLRVGARPLIRVLGGWCCSRTLLASCLRATFCCA